MITKAPLEIKIHWIPIWKTWGAKNLGSFGWLHAHIVPIHRVYIEISPERRLQIFDYLCFDIRRSLAILQKDYCFLAPPYYRSQFGVKYGFLAYMFRYPMRVISPKFNPNWSLESAEAIERLLLTFSSPRSHNHADWHCYPKKNGPYRSKWCSPLQLYLIASVLQTPYSPSSASVRQTLPGNTETCADEATSSSSSLVAQYACMLLDSPMVLIAIFRTDELSMTSHCFSSQLSISRVAGLQRRTNYLCAVGQRRLLFPGNDRRSF